MNEKIGMKMRVYLISYIEGNLFWVFSKLCIYPY